MSLNHLMKFDLLIYIKRYKLTSEKKSPLFLCISLNGKRVEIALKRAISPDLWDDCANALKVKILMLYEGIRVNLCRFCDLTMNSK